MKVTITITDLEDGELSIKCGHDSDGSQGARNASPAWQAAMDVLQFLADSSEGVTSAVATADGKKVDLLDHSGN